jgi:hypothetical protein
VQASPLAEVRADSTTLETWALPTQGPDPHASSNWERPGEEWGTFFRLEAPGAWTLQVSRGLGTASVPLTVAG